MLQEKRHRESVRHRENIRLRHKQVPAQGYIRVGFFRQNFIPVRFLSGGHSFEPISMTAKSLFRNELVRFAREAGGLASELQKDFASGGIWFARFAAK